MEGHRRPPMSLRSKTVSAKHVGLGADRLVLWENSGDCILVSERQDHNHYDNLEVYDRKCSTRTTPCQSFIVV